MVQIPRKAYVSFVSHHHHYHHLHYVGRNSNSTHWFSHKKLSCFTACIIISCNTARWVESLSSVLVYGRYPVRILAGLAYRLLTECIHCFLHSIMENSGIISWNRPQFLHPKSLHTHCSLSFNLNKRNINTAVKTASLNNLRLIQVSYDVNIDGIFRYHICDNIAMQNFLQKPFQY